MKKNIFLIQLFLLTFILSFMLPDRAVAQWVKTISPENIVVQTFVASGTKLLAGAREGLFSSTDNGKTWDTVKTGFTDLDVFDLEVKGSYIFASTEEHGVLRSDDNGITWSSKSTGLSSSYIANIAVNDNYIFAEANNSIFRSANNGQNWSMVYDGSITHPGFQSLLASGNNIFAGGIDASYRSTDNGNNWTELTLDIPLLSLTAVGTTIFGGTTDSLLRSKDNGNTWSTVYSGVPDFDIRSFAINDTNLFAGTSLQGVFHVSIYGDTLKAINTGLGKPVLWALFVHNGYLYAGTERKGIWRRALTDIITSDESKPEFLLPTTLSQNYPNPFHEITNIQFDVPQNSLVTLKILNLFGQEVTTLVSDNLNVGSYQKQWDASNVSPGIYFYQIRIGANVETKKMIVRD